MRGPGSVVGIATAYLFKNAVNCYDYTVLVTDKLMYTEHWWKDTDRVKLKYLKKILSQ